MIYDLQRAGIVKRVSAYVFDLMLIIVLAVGCLIPLVSITGFESKLNDLSERRDEIRAEFNMDELEEKHKITFDQYEYLVDEEKAALPAEVQDVFGKFATTYYSDPERNELTAFLISLSLVIVSFSILIPFILLEFVVPLLFKNGQTVGKKIFSIAVVTKDGVRISPMVLFIRTILGKYTIGTMVPVLMLLMLFFRFAPIIPIMILLLIGSLQVVMMFTSKTRSIIHDLLASTVVVDFQSQMIFDSIEAKEEYKRRIQEENDARSDY